MFIGNLNNLQIIIRINEGIYKAGHNSSIKLRCITVNQQLYIYVSVHKQVTEIHKYVKI